GDGAPTDGQHGVIVGREYCAHIAVAMDEHALEDGLDRLARIGLIRVDGNQPTGAVIRMTGDLGADDLDPSSGVDFQRQPARSGLNLVADDAAAARSVAAAGWLAGLIL